MSNLLPKRLYDVSRLAQTLLTHMLRLTDEVLMFIEKLQTVAEDADEERNRMRRQILTSICELFDTWFALRTHVNPARFARHVSNWWEIQCLVNETQFVMDGLKRRKEQFEEAGGVTTGRLMLKAGCDVLKRHLEKTVEVPGHPYDAI
jgi:hypothetical protein